MNTLDDEWDPDDEEGDAYDGRTKKRRKIITKRARVKSETRASSVALSPIIDFFCHANSTPEHYPDEPQPAFEETFDAFLADCLEVRDHLQDQESELSPPGELLRPLSRYEVSALIEHVQKSLPAHPILPTQPIALRKLKVHRERRIAGVPDPRKDSTTGPLVPLTPVKPEPAVNDAVLSALYSIRTTRYDRSFLSRLCGHRKPKQPGLLAVDWETQSPWMNLMTDIRDHFSLAHPEREQPEEDLAPITYSSLQRSHLEQVHDLLRRSFWEGVDVSDSFQHSPERCTVVAAYKNLVVGAALLSSPQETYITYLSVRAGWDNSQIATTMLYHLISLNPNKDITLHVSASNPAVLLYNRFGFKAEEFVAGFYEDYLDPQSRMSKNALRLRLRR
ncbi:hypothetical protein SERLA73DRAFT_187406 [Serpula lacrymans var. lacrymans S7.3]|uniref:N-acetyltransferase domain-containing protein n=2 Tax=Serpula lacrymans var. lacrymans TaxID=341189 RepID=F8Q945_SERL3|nr:uncharacterized protein SERLADRAFT_476924 [Serpula lacrymans var. lacrymans S7.9]EGN95100.1 hypothetical protein SERLA73DRAFT_187406 [Serpula lacrymans var. lacrymans S7.3]EGO20586.1 hypothetical protein SERLADRAFT_476924 [Serpula lacrymans var. lacrymans S7.9]